MDINYIMDYTGFELWADGYRHRDIAKNAASWKLNPAQVEELTKKLLEAEDRVYSRWLRDLPHYAVFKAPAGENTPRLSYVFEEVRGNYWHEHPWEAGRDALTTVARDLIERVGDAEQCLRSGIYPSLSDYTEELLILVRDFSRAVPIGTPKINRNIVYARARFEYWFCGPSLALAEPIFNQFGTTMTFEELALVRQYLLSDMQDFFNLELSSIQSEIAALNPNAYNYASECNKIYEKYAIELERELAYRNCMDEKNTSTKLTATVRIRNSVPLSSVSRKRILTFQMESMRDPMTKTKTQRQTPV